MTDRYDRDGARRLLEQELSDPAYQREFTGPLREAIDEFLRWLEQDAFTMGGITVPYGPLLVLVAVVAVVVLCFLWVRPRLQRNAAGEDVVHIDPTDTAEQLHRRAAGHAEQGRYDDAARDAFRALVRAAEERGDFAEQRGRTATEIAASLSAGAPSHAATLGETAARFNGSVYGGSPMGREDYQSIRRLAEQLEAAAPGAEGSTSGHRLVLPR